jgi:hypothetical protein
MAQRPGGVRASMPIAVCVRNISFAANAISDLLKIAILAFVIWAVFVNRSVIATYGAQWMATTTHMELSSHGISIDRQISAEQAINTLAKQRNNDNANLPSIDPLYARGAIVRAARNAPAMVGSRIL